MRIRKAEIADTHQIAQVHVFSWQAAYKGLLPDEYLASLSIAQREENWRNAITSSPTSINVCVDNHQIVGFVAFGRGRDEDAWTNQLGEIYAIYLLADCWGRGYGKRLLDSAVTTLEVEEYRAAILWVLDSNQRAIGFYQRNGFVADGQVKEDELTEGVSVTELRYARPFTVVL